MSHILVVEFMVNRLKKKQNKRRNVIKKCQNRIKEIIFYQAEEGIQDVTGVQTFVLPFLPSSIPSPFFFPPADVLRVPLVVLPHPLLSFAFLSFLLLLLIYLLFLSINTPHTSILIHVILALYRSQHPPNKNYHLNLHHPTHPIHPPYSVHL